MKKEKLKKGTIKIEVRSRKGDEHKLYLVGIVPTKLAGEIIELIIKNRI